MSLDDLNREQKRTLKRMGALDEKGAPTRAPKRPLPASARVPASTSVRSATRCARWRGRAAPKCSATRSIVVITVVIYTAFVGGIDYLMSLVTSWFYR